jgi:Cu-Zn family superoxide dismutase
VHRAAVQTLERPMRGRRGVTRGWVVAAAALMAGCGGGRMSASDPALMAWAELRDQSGESVGSAILREQDGQVRIVVQVSGLAPGRHGVHLHTVGRCEPPGFQSAGGHFNPLGKQHGLQSATGPHAGDLPDLEVDANGRAQYVAVTDRVTLGTGPTSLFDADGSAIVVHAGEDDQRTDPSGNSGDRILCGVLVAGPTSGFLPRP